MLLSQPRSARECAKGTFFIAQARQGNQLLAQHLGRADEREENIEWGFPTALTHRGIRGFAAVREKGVSDLNRKFVLRYLILIAFLAVCAGVVWYRTSASGGHAADTVLAKEEHRDSAAGKAAGECLLRKCAVRQGDGQEKLLLFSSLRDRNGGSASRCTKLLRRAFPRKYAVLYREIPEPGGNMV